MKLITISFLLIMSMSFGFGQSSSKVLRTETIDYKLGKATYQCYENPETSDLIKHGKFKYVENRKSDYGTNSVVIAGQFKDGYRDGLWSYSIKMVDFPNTGGTYTTKTLSSIQNFKNGLPNGVWKLDETWKTRNHSYFKGTYIWGVFDGPYNQSASTIFKDGVATGLTSYKDDLYKKSKTVVLTGNGFLTGDFSEVNSDGITENSFNSNGVMTKYVERSASGKVIKKTDFDPELLQTGEKYLAGKITKSELRDKYIKVDTAQFVLSDISEIFNDDYFYLLGIDGDKSITPRGGDERAYGRYIRFSRIELIPFEQHKSWPMNTTSAESKVRDYQHFLTYFADDISKEDIASIQQLIVKANEEMNNNYKNKDSEKQYSTLYEQINNLTKIPSKPSKTENSTPYSVNTHVYSRDIKKKINTCSKHAEELLFAYKYEKKDFTFSGYKQTNGDYLNSLKVLQEYINHLNNLQTRIDSIATLIAWSKDITFNTNNIECKYITNQRDDAFNVYSESHPKETNKPDLYNAYIKVMTYLINNTSNSTSFQECYGNMKRLDELCWYIVNGLNVKTAIVEKQLKGIEDPKMQLEIFISALKTSNQ